jgi:hypothetical protein
MLSKFVIRGNSENLQALLAEIRAKRGIVLEAFDPSKVIALLRSGTRLELGDMSAPPNDTQIPTSSLKTEGTRAELRSPVPTLGKEVQAGRNADGRLDVFYVGADHLIYHTWQLAPNGYWSGKNLLAR